MSNKEEVKKIIIEEATKKIFNKDIKKSLKENTLSIKENITPSEILKLAEEIEKINKKIDLRNPLISENDESLVDNIIKEHKCRDRQLDVDAINKNKYINFQNENEKDKWKRLMGYEVPTDDNRQ